MWCEVVRASRGMSTVAPPGLVRVSSSVPQARRQGLPASVYSRDWGRLRASARADTCRIIEGRRKPTGEVGGPVRQG